MILPTRRLAIALACAAPLALLGYVTPWGLDILLAADALLLGLAYADALLAVDPSRIDLTREAPSSLSIGRPGAAQYRWKNAGPRDARLVIRESWPVVIGGPQQPRALRVAAGGTLAENLTIAPVRRGRDSGGTLSMRSVGPLGLGMRQGQRAVPWEVTVMPALPASRLRATIGRSTRRQPGVHRMRRLGAGQSFERLRDWVPGDDIRAIDWKATARRRKPTTRQYEEERRQQVLLVLDAGRLMAAESGGVPMMEYAVRAAVDLAFAAYHHDDDVGVLVFGAGVEHYVAPQRGRRGLHGIMEVLAIAQPTLDEPDYPGAFRYLAMRNRKRALTVFIGDLIDRGASEALVAAVGSLRPRHLPLAVTLRNPEIDAAAVRRSTNPQEAWRRAAAEELLAARGGAVALMRRSGIVVLDTPPARAGEAAVTAYLEMKRRGRL
ncbi:MAG TPA: DUF58 domain-containing protein [Gemmatimonadales bacterium]